MSELRKIPNVGKATEADLIAMGYTTIESLRGADPQRLYEQECALRGQTIDRCQLYLYRAVGEYALSRPRKEQMVVLEGRISRACPLRGSLLGM